MASQGRNSPPGGQENRPDEMTMDKQTPKEELQAGGDPVPEGVYALPVTDVKH